MFKTTSTALVVGACQSQRSNPGLFKDHQHHSCLFKGHQNHFNFSTTTLTLLFISEPQDSHVPLFTRVTASYSFVFNLNLKIDTLL